VAPGAPRAQDALSWWLGRYAGSGSARVRVVQALLLAHQRGDARTAERAWLLAREPLHVLESGRGERELRRLEAPTSGGEPLLDPDGWFGQMGFVTGVAAQSDAGVGLATGGTAMVGPATEIFDLEGVIGVGVTATVDRAGAEDRLASLRGELLACVGGDGVLLWAGAGYGSGRRLHQLVQLESTTDGDQPWPFLALRLEVEEALGAPGVGGRALFLIGAKLGQTPD
jgi:hypothetical protein